MPRRAKYDSWNKGIPRTEEVKLKISQKLKGRKRPEDVIRKISASRKGIPQPNKKETAYKMGKANKGRTHKFYGPFIHSEESKRKVSETMKLKWKNGEIKRKSIKGVQWTDEHRKKAFKSLAIRPNKPELYLTNFLNILFPGEYRYVGDGQVWIEGKCPDWINKERKKIIEHFGRRWHKEKDEESRIGHFKKSGFDCLIIWNEELKDTVNLKDKLRVFNGNTS
jgi:very-short-patch-repair endonuclease